MSGAVAERLQTLVNDYYHGLLTFDSYREQRSKLFDAMQLDARRPPPEAAEATAPAAPDESDETQTNAALRPPPPEPVAPLMAAVAPPAPPPQARRLGRGAVLAGGGVAIAAAALVAYMALRPGTDDVPDPSGTDSAPAVALPPGAALLEQFAQRNVWAPDAVRNLEVTWDSALTDEQRRVARESPSYDRFGETLRRRLRQEEALSVAQVSTELESLISLAKHLEMPYAASLELPKREEPAVAATPPAVEVQAAPADPARSDAQAAVASSRPPAATPPPITDGGDAPPAAAAPTPPPRAATQAPATTPAPAAAAPAPVAAAVPSPEAVAGGAAQTAGDAACSAQLLETRRVPSCRDLLRNGQEGPALMIVPPGKFTMGGDGPNEGPAHEVSIKPIAMSAYEISAADFNLFCTSSGAACPENPWGAGDFPVVLVSFADATAYAAWLSTETGQRYRLPSEAEWEYAARAGTTTPYPFGDAVTPTAARSSANGAVDSPLARSDRSINRSAFRLFHMIGNVREWVADEWFADYEGAPTDGSARTGAAAAMRVVRGGAYADVARQLRSAARSSLAPDTRDRLTGFRVVRELPE